MAAPSCQPNRQLASTSQPAGTVSGEMPTRATTRATQRWSCEPASGPSATASEAMALLARGYDMVKFFPAEASGGVPALKSIGAPIPQVKFCPTGGVSVKNAPDYLALSNTMCVGGSWVAPKALVQAGDWKAITDLAAEAAALG